MIESQTAAVISRNPKFNGSDDRGRSDDHQIAADQLSCICIIQSGLLIVIQITNQLLVEFMGQCKVTRLRTYPWKINNTFSN